ncbi:MAG: hypothetical protein IKN16_11065 [Selenomonadaceae bacterium]|nr:hypothetical protein [Selenomonadaceae bacterium]
MRATGDLVQYAYGDGNDTIVGFNESDTLTITSASYTTELDGDDVIVRVYEGSIRLVGANGKNLNINKTGSTEIITLTEDDDELNNYLGNVTIYSGAGNDTISLGYANLIQYKSGDGNDLIQVSAQMTL